MGRRFFALCVCLVTLPVFCQPPSPKPQVATITAVTLRPTNAGNGDRPQYDVSLKIGDALYVVLFAPSGPTTVQYSAGMNLVVQVGSIFRKS